MIQLTLSDTYARNDLPLRSLDGLTIDPLGGYSPSLTPEQVYERNKGRWHLNPKRVKDEGHEHVLVAHNGRIVGVWQIVGTKPWHEQGHKARRYLFRGVPLEPGDALYDEWVGQEAPYKGSRNPVHYLRGLARAA